MSTDNLDKEVPGIENKPTSTQDDLECKPVKSPCIRMCCLNEQDICLGCFRSLEEIKSWTLVDNTEKLLILANAQIRKQISPGFLLKP
jgi:hypothetical protein